MTLFASRPHIGLNINDRSIELARVDVDTLPKTLLGIARAELASDVITHGKIQDPNALKRAILSVKIQAGFQEKEQVYLTLSISEYLIFPFPVVIPPLSEKRHIIAAVKEEAKKRVPIPEAQQRIFVIQETLTQGKLFAYAIDTNITDTYERLLTECNCIVEYIEPDSIALSRYMLPDIALDQILTLIDVGTNITHIITFANGYPVLSQHIPVGAETIHDAVEMYGVENKKMSQILQSFAEDIKDKMTHAVEYTHTQSTAHHVIRMVGGGSLLPHISEIVERHIHHTVTPGHVAHTLTLNDSMKAHDLPIYAHAIGSALRGATRVAGSSLVPLESFEPKSSRTNSLDETKKRILLLGTLVVLAVIALLGLTIFNNPKNTPAKNSTSDADPSLTTGQSILVLPVDITTFVPNSYEVIEKTHNESLAVVSTGTKITEGQAQGLVRIFNTASTERPLVEGTRLETEDGITVRIVDNILIPPNGTIDIEAISDAQGSSGNLPANVRLSVPGLSSFNQETTYGETLENFTGGTIATSVVQEEDITRARNTILAIGTSILQKEFLKLESNEKTIIQFPDQTIIIDEASQNAGDVSDQVSVTVLIRAYSLSFDTEILKQEAQKRIGPAKTVIRVSILPGSFDIKTQKGSLSLTITYSD